MTTVRWIAVCCLGVGCQQDVAGSPIFVEVPVVAPCVCAAPKPPPPPPQPDPPRVRPAAIVPRHMSQPAWFVALSATKRSAVTKICRMKANDPCAGVLPRPRGEVDPIAPLYAALGSEVRDDVDAYCAKQNRGKGVCDTPLVFAPDGQGIDLTPGTSARFAFRAGAPVATDWPSATTPWLALDRDGDGAITSGAELFGDATVLPDGRTAHDGFAALAALDENGDGVIDARDASFASLLLWSDRNGDRASSPDELRPLAEVVTSIPLATTRGSRCTSRGNCEGERGLATWRDSEGVTRKGAVVDIYLRER